VNELADTKTSLGAHCNPQGRVISLFRIFLYGDNYYLQMPRELLPIAIAALKKYAVFFKVNLQDVSDEFTQIGYIGQEPSLQKDAFILKISGIEPRYEVISKNQNTTASNSENNWKYLDIKNGIPAIYPETSEKFLPHEIDLPKLNGVSFKKGCYTGQEIIARMEYRGKLKNHLYHAHVETDSKLIRGADIYRKKDRCGSIVDYCQVGYNNYELLVIAPESDVTTTLLSLDPEQKIILKFT
jgi:folate-binding protein YgfZ